MLTWGASQHYGNPYLRSFDPVTMCLKEQGAQQQQQQVSEALRPVPEI